MTPARPLTAVLWAVLVFVIQILVGFLVSPWAEKIFSKHRYRLSILINHESDVVGSQGDYDNRYPMARALVATAFREQVRIVEREIIVQFIGAGELAGVGLAFLPNDRLVGAFSITSALISFCASVCFVIFDCRPFDGLNALNSGIRCYLRSPEPGSPSHLPIEEAERISAGAFVGLKTKGQLISGIVGVLIAVGGLLHLIVSIYRIRPT